MKKLRLPRLKREAELFTVMGAATGVARPFLRNGLPITR